MRKVIEIAKNEVGYHETGTNITKYTAYFEGTDFYNGSKGNGKTWGCEWCDCFNDYCFCNAYGMETTKKMLYQGSKSCGAGCKFSADYFRKNGKFVKRGEAEPQEGWQIFFGSYGNESHTGLVEKVENGRVYTIEGNSNDAVRANNYSLNYTRISGYGVPDFSLVEEKTDKPEPAPAPVPAKTVDELAREVIAGKWGVGNARKLRLEAAGYDYTAVQNRVNELLKTPATTKPTQTVTAPKKYRVTSRSGLNVRAGRSTKYQKLPPALKYGEIIEVSNIVNGWAQLYGRSGFVAANYITKV